MEENRNVDFDSGVEIVSLIDAVWRLTTRVYLLEDFIAERFGEVIGPSGFTKKATATSGPATSDPMSSSMKDSVSGSSISSSPIIIRSERNKFGRKPDHDVSCETEGQSQNIQKTPEKEGNIESDDEKNMAILGLDFEQSENDPLLIHKDEVILSDYDGGDTNDYVLNESSDDDDDPNETLEKDPDFNPSPLVTDDDSCTDIQDQVNPELTVSGHCDDSNQKSNLTTHMKIRRENKAFSCSVCKKTFSWQYQLNCHFRTHTGEKPFVCKICGKGYSEPSSLKTHSRIHTGVKSFVCKICGKGFFRQSILTDHSRTHTGEKPFVCSFCGKGYSQSYHLTVHSRTHTGEKPFVCKICGKGFSESGRLTKHSRTHTGEKLHLPSPF